MKRILSNNFYTKIGAAIILIAAFVVPVYVIAFSSNHDFPRVAAWQLNANKTPLKELARYDVVILDMNAQNTNPNIFSDLRRLNKDIVILAYTSPIEYPKAPRLATIEPRGSGLWHDLGKGLQTEWDLKTWQGESLSFWSGNKAMNPGAVARNGQTYAQYLGNFLSKNVLATGNWDGLIFDTVWQNVSWVNEDIDINNDGRKDSLTAIDQGWRQGQQSLFDQIRGNVGDNYLIVTNGDGQFEDSSNGRMFESFPEFWEGGWPGSIERYFFTDANGYLPRLNILNSDTDNTGNFSNYRRMRFGLTSSLLGNGYYNFDYGTLDRSFVEYYDEYAVSLGRPTSAGYNLLSNDDAFNPGLWRRDFENGISLVNSTAETRTVVLPGEFEKLHGKQDPLVNNGQVVSRISLAPQDGIVLLRPLQEVLGSVYTNGSFARIFSADTRVIRSSFFSFDERFEGSQRILKTDIDNDGTIETLAADGSSITIYEDNGSISAVFYPYTKNYNLGINFGVGDLNGDGTQEIITGTERGGGPQIRIFSSDGRLINPGFFAYGTDFRGGVHVTVGDLNGDGINEIIAGAGFGGGPHIRVFNRDGKLINPGFFAYDAAFRGGVYVAAGDIDGDGIDEIISGPGPTGGPHVRVWNKEGRLLTEFFAFTAQSNAGVEVAVYDFDGDRRDEIIGLTTDFFSFDN